jgi:hypothetical protein
MHTRYDTRGIDAGGLKIIVGGFILVDLRCLCCPFEFRKHLPVCFVWKGNIRCVLTQFKTTQLVVASAVWATQRSDPCFPSQIIYRFYLSITTEQ